MSFERRVVRRPVIAAIRCFPSVSANGQSTAQPLRDTSAPSLPAVEIVGREASGTYYADEAIGMTASTYTTCIIVMHARAHKHEPCFMDPSRSDRAGKMARHAA